jgi:hypothetical protein
LNQKHHHSQKDVSHAQAKSTTDKSKASTDDGLLGALDSSLADRTMLRLVCITLPNQQALEKHPLYKLPRPGATGPHGSTESTDHTTPMAGASSLAAMIPLLHRTVIQKLRREVTALASAEILRSLMDVHPITEEVLALVQRELSLLPALHVTNFEVKLRVLLLLKSEILIVLAILFIINSVINSAIILQIFCLHSVITSRPRRIIYH